MSSQAYYKDRLGFEPDDQSTLKRARTDRPYDPKAKQAYEENLSKFKDERDAIQKKTFTKWVNKHLKKANRQVTDLFTDLQDGLNLISLLEVLTGEQLHREKGRMRFHMLQNVELVLNFLRFKQIKLVNIRPEDIVDGNPKLTLGLIWTIILHFQISDIVVGEEPNVSARDVLLRWAKKVTAKYPGVRVTDFTQSWRDGCAFSAIINRNRPDLLEWRTVKTKTVRERLETAFYAAEKVGVTRLLDPEDVDTQEIDEKSIITYVSSLYDVFPEVPARHPLYDSESQALVQEYREVASSLHLWIRERTTYFSSALPNTLSELNKLATESSRFKSEQIPPRARDKQKLHHIYRDLQKYFEAVGEVEIEPELHVDLLDRNWNKLLSLHQERDLAIQEEIKKWERLNRLAEKVQREVKRVDGRLDDLESKINEEARRLDRLHPLDAKHNVDLLESELRLQEEQIQGLFQDVQALKSGNHHDASNLHKRVNKLHGRWVSLRSMLHSKLIARLASVSFPVVEERTVTRQTRTVLETRLVDTNTHFRSLQQAIEWCKTKLKQLEEAEYGQEVHVVKSELAFHQREHKEIDKFQSKVDQCVAAKSNFHGEELSLYMGQLTTLQKLYAELLTFSNKRLSDLETLLDLLQSVSNQLSWLQDKQQVEINRDWTDKDLSLQTLNHYYQNLMSELEKREVSVRSVVERGQSLLLGGHRGAHSIEAVLHNLNGNWAYLLQLTLALETHMSVLSTYRQFHQDLSDTREWINSKDEVLNTTYSVVEFGLDEGERLLKGMQELREQLNAKAAVIQELQERAQNVSPIKQRRQPVNRPIPVKAVCDYKQQNMNIDKNNTWMMHDNSALTHWRVSDSAGLVDVNIPGVIFVIPPPCKESIDAAAALAQQYQRTLALWQRKQLRMRQNMIFATIRVVRSWDLAQFVAMGSEQRNAIRKALNEDADKLLQEGEPTDPHLRRLRIEMEEVNRLFDDFERRARQEEETKSLVKQWNDVMQNLEVRLDEFERTLNTRLSNSIPRDVHSLEHMVIQHKDFETSLKGVTPDIENAQAVFRNIPRKTPQLQSSLDTMLKRWNLLWNSSHIYTERLKCVEMLLNGMDEANTSVSELELKLASFGEMPAEIEPLHDTHDELIRVQNALAERQPLIDRLIEDATTTRRTVVRSRDRVNHSHHDLDRMDDDVNALTTRWNNLCANLLDRLRSCEGSYRLLENYGKTYQTEVKYIDEAYSQLNNVPLSKLNVEPTKVLFTSIVERTQPLEQVNIDGGRFIREAKIYNLRLVRFVEEVEEWQPSVDAVRRSVPRVTERDIAAQLDRLNHRFLALCAILKDRLTQLALDTADTELLELVKANERTQLRTFRTEFTLFESTSEITTTHVYTNGDMGNKMNGGDVERKERLIEDEGTGGVLGEVGIVDERTGERLTVAEAIRRRVLDVRAGTISGKSISEASSRGLIDKQLADRLLGPCGSITLLQAIQKELAEAERGPAHRVRVSVHKWLRGILPTKIPLSDAVTQNLVDTDGSVLDRLTGERFNISDAIEKQILDGSVNEIVSGNRKITLKEAVDSGIITNRYEPSTLTIPEAVKLGFIEKPLTLKDVVEKKLYKDGEITHKAIPGVFTIKEAKDIGIIDSDNLLCISNENDLITLNEALEKQIITGNGEFNFSGSVINVPLAVKQGLISSVENKSIFEIDAFLDDETNNFVNLNEALKKNIIDKNGEFVLDRKAKFSIPLEEAVDKGLIRKEIFEKLNQKIGIMSGGKELNVFGAVVKEYISPKTGFLLEKRKKVIHLNEAMDKKLITEDGVALLLSLLNITVTTQMIERTFIRQVPKIALKFEEAVRIGLVDVETQTYTEPESGKVMSIEVAVKEGLLVMEKGRKSPIKEVIKKAREMMTGKKSIEIPDEGMFLSKAIEEGMLDPVSGMFVISGTDRLVSFEECIRLGIIRPDSAKVVDVKKNRDLNLSKALEKHLLDSVGHYGDEQMTLKEAIDKGYVVLEETPVINYAVILGNNEPVQTAPGVIFEPGSGLVISTGTGEAIPLLDAIKQGKVDEKNIRVKHEGVVIGLKEAVDRGIVDMEKGEMQGGKFLDAAKAGAIIVFGAPLVATNSAVRALKKAFVKDPTTGEEITMNKALERGIVDTEILRKCEERVSSLKHMGSKSVSLEDDSSLSLSETTSVSRESSSRVVTSSATMIEREVSSTILQKIKKKIVSSQEAIKLNLIDEETSALLNDPNSYKKDGQVLSLSEAISVGLIDGNKGKLKDPHNGEVLTIKDAIDRGILDAGDSSGNVLVPVGHSLTIPELIKQGLIIDNKIIHPDTGEELNLLDAITCDIVDYKSKVKDLNGDEITLEEAIKKRLIDSETLKIKTEDGGEVDLVQGVKDKLFPEENRISFVPPVAITFPAALKNNLVDLNTSEIVNPCTGEKKSVKDAIEENSIMSIPCNTVPNSISVSEALEKGMIENQTFVDPERNLSIPVSEAISRGILVVKPNDEEASVSILTETVRKVQAVEKYLITPGYEIVDKFVKNRSTGELIPFAAAIEQGIVKTDSQVTEKKELKPRPHSFAEAVKGGLIDFEKGVYTDPETGKVVQIKDALVSGTLNVEPQKTDKKENMDLSEALETIYDEEKSLFKNPKDGKLIGLDEAIKEGIIDANAAIYDVSQGRPVSIAEAVNSGLLDTKGRVKDKSGNSISVKEATKLGLMAVIGAPILATKAVVDAVKSLKRQSSKDKSPETETAPEVKNLALKEAINAGVVKPEETIISMQIAGEDKDFTVRDALDKGLISLNNAVDVTDQVVRVPKEKFRLELSKGLTPKDLALINAYNIKDGRFINPKTKRAIAFDDWLNTCNVLNPSGIIVKDLNTDEFIPLSKALEQGDVIDNIDGSMRDPRTGKIISFFEAVKLGWITSASSKKRNKPLLGLGEAISRGLLDPVKCEMRSPTSDEIYTICQAVVENILDPEQILIRHPVTDQLLPLTDSIDSGLVSLNKGTVINPTTGVENGFDQAFLAGYVRPNTKPVSIQAIVEKGFYNPKTCKIADIITKQEVEVPEAVKRGILDSVISECKDVKEDQFIPIRVALEQGMINDGKLKNTKNNKLIPLDAALKDGLIKTKEFSLSLIDAINLGYYAPKQRNFLNPKNGNVSSLQNCIQDKFINPNLTKLKDPRNDKFIPTDEAISSGLLDDKKNVLTYPFIMSLDVAYAKGYVLPSVKPFSMSELLVQGFYNPSTCSFSVDGENLTLKECLEKGVINGDAPSIRDPVSGDIISVNEAIKKGLIDPENCSMTDKNGVPISLYDALEKGLLLPAKRRFSLPEAVYKGLYDLKTGTIVNPKTSERLPIDRAIEKGVIDPASTIVKVQPGQTLTFEHAVEEGIVEAKSGTIKIGDNKLDFQEAFDSGILVEAHRPMALREAVTKGIYNDNTGLFLDPRTGEHLPLSIALESHLLDPDSVHVKDTKKGFWNKMSLTDAIARKCIDGQTGKVKDSNGAELTLLQAMEAGLIVDATTSVSLQRAIHQGLYDDKSGKFADPKSGAKITLHEAIRRFIINPLLPCYLDEKEEKLLPLKDVCRLGIIDRRLGSFKDPRSNYHLNLSVAMDLGLIVDIETAGFGLHHALVMGLYDRDTKIFKHPATDQLMTLSEAVSNDLVNPHLSIVKDSKSGLYMNLSEAVKEGIIDDKKSLYVFKDTAETIDLMEAKKRNLIVPSKKGLDLEEVVKLGLFDSKEGKIIDPCSNKQRNLSECLEAGVVIPDTTGVKDSNGVLKSLLHAIQDGTVDPVKCTVMDPVLEKPVQIDVAFENNILVKLEKPLGFQEAVRKGSAEFERSLSIEKALKDSSLEDAVKYGLIDPDLSVVKNPQTGKFISLKEAVPLGLVDLHKKVTFPLAVGKTKPRCAVLEEGNIIYLKEPRSFSSMVENNLIDFNSGRVIDEGDVLPLIDAFSYGIIDPDSVVVKDTAKRRLYRLPEAFKKGIVDDRGNVLDTENSKLFNIKVGLDNGVLAVDKLSLIDALDYGVYNPTTGNFTDPFCSAGGVTDRRRLNLSEALRCGLIDPNTTVLRDPMKGNITSLEAAIIANALDPVAGRMVDPSTEKSIDLIKAKDKGFLIAAETRQAMEEKYKLCDETLRQLLEWIGELEDRLAKQDPVQEDLDMLRNQINIMKLMKEEVESQSRVVSTCLDEVRSVVSSGSEYLSRDEITSLERNAKSLRTRYERASERTDLLLRRLVAAGDELSKFSSEVSIFSTWMERAERGLEERERAMPDPQTTRDFVSDVISHQADLRFITMAAHKFFTESKDFLDKLNEYRSGLGSRLGSINERSESRVRNQVTRLSEEYKELLARANRLADKLTGVGGRQREYSQALDRLKSWLNQAEPQAIKVVNEPIAADPHSIEEQLNRAKTLNNEFISQGRLVDNLKQACESLVRSLEGSVSPREIKELESPVRDLEDRYSRSCRLLTERISSVEQALLHSQGVEQAIDSLTAWVQTAENNLKALSRPASLHKDRLELHIREVAALITEIDGERVRVIKVSEQARPAGNNPRLAARLDSKCRDLQTRLDKLTERSRKQAETLADVHKSLVQFLGDSSDLERLASDLREKLTSAERPEQLMEATTQAQAGRDRLEPVLREARSLVARKDVTDTPPVRDKIKSLEAAWRDLVSQLEEKQRLTRARQEQASTLARLKEQVLSWLSTMETRVTRLEPPALRVEIIKNQTDEIKPLLKEHRDFGPTVDRLVELASTLEDSPTHRRRSSLSPSKRRPSQIVGVEEEVAEASRRYSNLGTRLTDRQTLLDSLREEVKRATDSLKTLDSFLEKIARTMPRDAALPHSKEEADKQIKLLKGIIEEMYEKQALLESTKTTVTELLRKQPTGVGADQLREQLTEIVAKWKSLSDMAKLRVQILEDVKEVLDTHESMNTWLAAKEKMLGALGPISAEPRVVQSQIQQVQVLREEVRTQQPSLVHLGTLTRGVTSAVPDSPDTQRLTAKVSTLTNRYDDLASKLDERAKALGAAEDSARELGAALARITDAMRAIADRVDSVSRDAEPQQQLYEVQACERQTEGLRPLLADAESTGERLATVLSDKQEIQAKLTGVRRQFDALLAQIEQRRAEIEAMMRDSRELEEACARTLGWIQDSRRSLTERLLVSADSHVLQQQLDHHEPIYKEVISKEHEVIMLLDKGKDSRQLDNVRASWDKLKREVVDRHTRLQTAMEQCKKYYKALESFIPWISQAENRLESLRPDNFTKKDVEKHLRDLANFRNDVWKKSGEFEHMMSLGESFIQLCDIDKDIVKQEMLTIKQRWDKLSNEVGSRTSEVEEWLRDLGEFGERQRELSHSLQRCEDKLAAHDAVGATDAASLARLRATAEEAAGLARNAANHVDNAQTLDRAAPCRSCLGEEARALAERLSELQARLDDRCSVLLRAQQATSQFGDRLKATSADLSALDAELDGMKPPARDLGILNKQIEQLHTFMNKMESVSEGVRSVVQSADSLVDSGYCDASGTRVPAAALERSLVALEERAKTRERTLAQAHDKLTQFYELLDHTSQDIENAEEEVNDIKAVGSDPETIRAQQAELQRLKASLIEPLVSSVDQVNRSGQALIQTAASGVSTIQIEKDLENINNKYNTLKEKLNERGRKLDSGLLQSGKFQEALEGLSKWLSDTEEMVANQRSPSADYKVVKAQLQEQKFLIKMIGDREASVGGLASMGSEVIQGADPAERIHVERQIQDVLSRFDRLNHGANQRMDALQQTISIAKLFQDKLVPVMDWLDRTEKKIKDMELVPTDEEKIQLQIRDHNALHNEILRKKTSLTELTDVGSQLMSLVGEDEASNVADRVQEIADRYSRLVDGSEGVGTLLESSRSGLRHLVLTYQQLQAWMEAMEVRLGRYKVLGVHTEKLVHQMEELAEATEEVSRRQGDVDGTVDTGLELMKHISSDEALRLKDKLDSLQRRYNGLTSTSADLLRAAQQALPLVQQFHSAHARLSDWMMAAESLLQHAEPSQHDIHRLEQDIHEFRPVLENINQLGPQLCSLSPGEGAATIEGLVTRDNRRFDSIVEQIQRKAERLHLSQQRSLEVLGDIDSLLEWFREVEGSLRDADPPSSDPQMIRLQLKEHRALNDDISSQKGRVRDVLATAKKVLRESNVEGEAGEMRDKMSELREIVESAWALSGERLSVLEQALALAQHLLESHSDLAAWLTEVEQQVKQLPLPAIRPQAIAQQQDRTQMLMQSIIEHKPLVDKLNKTGEALMKLVVEEEGVKVQELLDADNARYSAVRQALKQRQDTLEHALQESSQFSDKLEGMLRALANAAEEVSSAEPVSAHPPKIKQQQNENQALIDDLNKRQEAFDAVKRAAQDVISKAPNAADPAVKDVKKKLERLTGLWKEVEDATKKRGRSLEEALGIAAKFWTELQGVMATLADLEASLASQQPPAARPQAIERQQRELSDIKAEMDATRPDVEHVRRSGESLMALCGEPDKPEVRKHIEDLDHAWDTVTALFAKREENLINAMEKAMEFHETLQDLLEFLKKAEDKFEHLGPLGSDIGTVKTQINELKQFKQLVDPYMVKVEALNRQAGELTERTSAEGAAGLRESLTGVNQRWDHLHRGLAERARQLEHSLLRLGQFQHALAELVAWIRATDHSLDHDINLVPGDSHLLEIELAKLKVLVNDIQAHQASVDTLNDAGRQLIESDRGTSEASSTQDKLNSLNSQWKDLMQKASNKHRELEEALQDAHRFGGEVQDLVGWLTEVEGVMSSSKPVGGLPETASEQLERFMEVYREVENARPRVEAALARGQEYLKKGSGPNSHLGASLKTLKQRWDSVTSRANDKKIKLEIALKEATDFHQSLQSFVDWLTSAEKNLSSLKPVSRVLETILQQIEEHKSFQKEVSVHRETMIQLDKKGTHLKYFSQKQDVILIKNLLISVQHRWERVVSKSAERTRALDHGYKEAKEFHDSWSNLMKWLKDTERVLDEAADDLGSDPQTLKQRLATHRDTQKALASKQPQYDGTLRAGKTLRERAPKTDETALKAMVQELKEQWNTVCGKAVERQRRLEEALLCSGQLRDALDALIDWLNKTSAALKAQPLVHGDLDTVHGLIDRHKVVEKEMSERRKQMISVEKTGADLTSKGGSESQALSSQLNKLQTLWRETSTLVESRGTALHQALSQAEELHKAVHMLLEWLSDAEMKLRFVDSLPDDDLETRNQIAEHEKLLAELKDKERDKTSTILLAENILTRAHPDAVPIIKHWVTIIESRWEEVSSWARARSTKLTEHLTRLQDLDNLLEELLDWLARVENNLLEKERQELPSQIPALEGLIKEHQEYMEHIMVRQTEVDAICKAKQQKPVERKPSSAKKMSAPSRDDLRMSSSNLVQVSRKPSLKSSRDNLGTLDRKSSRAGIKEFIDSGMTPHFGPRFPVNRSSEAELRSPRARLLWDRWRNVWLLTWERQRRLQQALSHLHELERLANFSWDEWRKRFLKFMNHKKARITDLFRKMDKDNNNLLPRDDFIDGIIKTKFGTSVLEMGAVADMFDHNSEGIIDWKEFIAALRPDWEERQPTTEADKIHDEVKRLVMLCTCRQKFRVFQVGEGKYRFGDSQKLRLVRILRSTVMVRVGGGWVALEEFLVKNDPCRAKGRTNIELREQFILADGVSQSMSAFKPKSSTSSQRASLSSHGPITKVKEKTSRSVPMTKTSSRGTPGSVDSLSDNESPATTPYRRPYRSSLNTGGSLPGSRGSSRPASRQGSKPPSRHGSTLSLASSDDGTPSRIPRRSTPGSVTASRTTSQRKTTAPALNGTKSPSPRSQIPRASSIPTLKVNRVSSGALRRGSETKTPSSNTSPDKTPTEPRAPFRL